MNHRNFVPCVVCVVLLVGTSFPQAQKRSTQFDQADPIRRARSPIPGRYIVTLRTNDDPEGVGIEQARVHRGRLRHAYHQALRGFSIELPEAAARALARDPRVERVEEDGVTRGDAMREQLNVQSWGLDRVDQRRPPLDGRYDYASTGAGVNVYIIDSGIRTTHVSFQGHAFGAYNAMDDGIPSDVDCNGHGTHVAGIVGSDSSGVAKDVTLYSVKALFCDGSGAWSDYIEAIDWVVTNHRKPAVINASIGGGIVTAAADAIERAVAAGITFVGAAGNQGDDACSYIPGAAPSAIVVGNAMQGDERAPDSNYGSCVDLFAPGSGIRSADNTSDTGEVDRWGTSMAAPHVAGAAALYLEHHPTATPAQVRAAIVGGATRGVLISSTIGTGSPNRLLFTRYLGDVVAPTVTITSPASGATVSGTVSVEASAADDAELNDVLFSVDGTALGVDSSAPFQVSWDTQRIANGMHTLNVEARDRAGNRTVRTVSVRVANGATGAQGWVTGSIGAATGQGSYKSSSLVLEASGTDVWGTADDFYFAHRSFTGDGEIVARVASLVRPPDAQFAMAGLMFRESLAGDSRHAALLISSDGKVKFRRRSSTGGTTISDGPSAGTLYAPAWLKLSRRANVFSASFSIDGTTWAPVYSSATITMGATVEVGVLALRNGGSGIASATFENIGMGRAPAGWSIADVGAVGRLGMTTASADVFSLRAGGTDLWATSDAFHLAYRPWAGDGEIIAKVESLTPPADSNFILAAITMRESLDANARHASLAVTTQGKVKFRRRTTVGGTTASDGPSAGPIPVQHWLRLTRRGHTMTAYTSTDGVQWQPVFTSQQVVMPPTVYIGILGLRNGGAGVARVRFSNVVVRSLTASAS